MPFLAVNRSAVGECSSGSLDTESESEEVDDPLSTQITDREVESDPFP